MQPTIEPVIERTLDLSHIVRKKSHFLFGPRQTGKTFWIRRTFPEARYYDLLDSATYLSLSREPGRLAQEVIDPDRPVVIDEIQRLPELLNEIHRLIESRRIRFLLTGSSARKLRRGGVNLLGGRARTRFLHPFTRRELGDHYQLERAVGRGLLPSIYFSDDPKADLESYAGAYLQQEVVAEGATRNVEAFSRFLKVAAFCNGTIVNFTEVANDAQVPRTTVYEYFEILKDTLVLHELPAWRESRKRKPLVSSKYYFFDSGVVSALQGRDVRAGTPEFGEALETSLMHELRSHSDYISGEPLAYWRSTSGFEVDFLIGDHTAVELKAKRNVAERDLRALHALAEERTFRRLFCVALEPRPRRIGPIEVLPWGDFLDRLWGGGLR
ncbi:MAG: ATP-binding protein [Candidatus Binatia bacterium]